MSFRSFCVARFHGRVRKEQGNGVLFLGNFAVNDKKSIFGLENVART